MKIKPVLPITKQQSYKYREKTLLERIEDIKHIQGTYPVGHPQNQAINAQIARLEALIENGRKY